MAIAFHDLTCREMVELVTDYLEGGLSPRDRGRFEEHLVSCEGCTAYVEQMRATLRVTGSLTAEDVEPRVRAELLRVLRDWRRHEEEDGT